MNYKTLLGFSIIVYGILSILNGKLIHIPANAILGIALMLYGIPAVYISFNYHKRNMIVFSSITFFTGIFLVLNVYYKVYSYTTLVLFIIFVCSAIFFLLFIEETKKKYYLYTSIFLLLILYPAVKIIQKIESSYFIYHYLKIGNIILPIIFILLGISLFLKRND
ncbi:MAG: hypothetical protein QHH13_14180 [Melioribacter sp.]|nr:hypothetical protein [Melioribacter sp.]